MSMIQIRDIFEKVKVVSIARLDFPQAGLFCEGAGMAEAEVPSIEQRAKVMEKYHGQSICVLDSSCFR